MDGITDLEYDQYKICYENFMDSFCEEDEHTPLYHNGSRYRRTNTMLNALEDRRYWFLNALRTSKGL